MYLILLFLTCMSVFVNCGDSDEEKYIDLLPEEEKREFLEKIAKRILEEAETKNVPKNQQAKLTSINVTDEMLDKQNDYVSKLLKQEAQDLRRAKGNITASIDSGNNTEITSDNNIKGENETLKNNSTLRTASENTTISNGLRNKEEDDGKYVDLTLRNGQTLSQEEGSTTQNSATETNPDSNTTKHVSMVTLGNASEPRRPSTVVNKIILETVENTPNPVNRTENVTIAIEDQPKEKQDSKGIIPVNIVYDDNINKTNNATEQKKVRNDKDIVEAENSDSDFLSRRLYSKEVNVIPEEETNTKEVKTGSDSNVSNSKPLNMKPTESATDKNGNTKRNFRRNQLNTTTIAPGILIVETLPTETATTQESLGELTTVTVIQNLTNQVATEKNVRRSQQVSPGSSPVITLYPTIQIVSVTAEAPIVMKESTTALESTTTDRIIINNRTRSKNESEDSISIFTNTANSTTEPKLNLRIENVTTGSPSDIPNKYIQIINGSRDDVTTKPGEKLVTIVRQSKDMPEINEINIESTTVTTELFIESSSYLPSLTSAIVPTEQSVESVEEITATPYIEPNSTPKTELPILEENIESSTKVLHDDVANTTQVEKPGNETRSLEENESSTTQNIDSTTLVDDNATELTPTVTEINETTTKNNISTISVDGNATEPTPTVREINESTTNKNISTVDGNATEPTPTVTEIDETITNNNISTISVDGNATEPTPTVREINESTTNKNISTVDGNATQSNTIVTEVNTIKPESTTQIFPLTTISFKSTEVNVTKKPLDISSSSSSSSSSGEEVEDETDVKVKSKVRIYKPNVPGKDLSEKIVKVVKSSLTYKLDLVPEDVMVTNRKEKFVKFDASKAVKEYSVFEIAPGEKPFISLASNKPTFSKKGHFVNTDFEIPYNQEEPYFVPIYNFDPAYVNFNPKSRFESSNDAVKKYLNKPNPIRYPIYNYEAENAYVNEYNLRGPNKGDENIVRSKIHRQENDDPVEISEAELQKILRDLDEDATKLSGRSEDSVTGHEKGDNGTVVEFSSDILVPSNVLKPKEINEDDLKQIINDYEIGREDNLTISENLLRAILRVDIPDSNEADHPINAFHKTRFKDHVWFVRHYMHENKRFRDSSDFIKTKPPSTESTTRTQKITTAKTTPKPTTESTTAPTTQPSTEPTEETMEESLEEPTKTGVIKRERHKPNNLRATNLKLKMIELSSISGPEKELKIQEFVKSIDALAPSVQKSEDLLRRRRKRKKKKKKKEEVSAEETLNLDAIRMVLDASDNLDVYAFLKEHGYVHKFSKPKHRLRSRNVDEEEELDPMIKVMNNLVNTDSSALGQYDWLTTTVEIRSALKKLFGLVQTYKQDDNIHLYDLQLLKYFMYLYGEAVLSIRKEAKHRRSFRSSTYRMDDFDRGVLPKSFNSRKRSTLIKEFGPLKKWFNTRRDTHWIFGVAEKVKIDDFESFLKILDDALFDLHDAIKHISLITSYGHQNWYKNLRELYLSHLSRKNMIEIILHLVTSRLIHFIEDSSLNGAKNDYLKYIKDHTFEVNRTLEEFRFVIKLLYELQDSNRSTR